jgi:single-strand DNA-binding protein
LFISLEERNGKMASLNQATLIGYLGDDPDYRVMADGKAVATLRLATTDTWKDKTTGEKKELTEWHRVSLFDQRAEFAHAYLKKGSQVFIQGEIRTRKWTDKEGIERYTTEIRGSAVQSLDRKPAAAAEDTPVAAKPAKPKASGGKGKSKAAPMPDAFENDDAEMV